MEIFPMTEVEVAKLIFTSSPAILTALGVAKIWWNAKTYIREQKEQCDQFQLQLNAHAEAINLLIKLHGSKHPEDLGQFLKEVK